MTIEAPISHPGPLRRASAFFNRHRGLKLTATLSPPLAWMAVIYLGSLSLLLITAFWRLDALTGKVVPDFSLHNFNTIATTPVYRTIAVRTLSMAVAVTLADIALAFPVAYFMARIASPRTRSFFLVAVVVPLWTNYLVRVFAWKTLLSLGGPIDAFLNGVLHMKADNLGSSSIAVWITFTYLWLPFVILPIYASLERVPSSLLEASADLGARSGRTFRSVIWPLAFPGIVAASIFSFSLTLGDYLTPTLVGKGIFIGNTIYNYVGIANNLPLAAAFAFVPIVIVAIYMTIARFLGAFEAL